MRRAYLAFLPFLSLVAWQCAPAEAPPEGTSRAAIVGGEADPADPAIVLVAMQAGSDGTGGGTCTGAVVSPHVIVTAAHCLDPRVVGADSKPYYVYLGDDLSSKTELAVKSNFVKIAETHFHPEFTPGATTHDIGVVVTAAPLSMTPLRMNRAKLDATAVGTSVRMVGYGVYDQSPDANPDAQAAKHTVSVPITTVDDESLGYADAQHGMCEGDSGGPSLRKRADGSEEIVGVHSFSLDRCRGRAFDTRMDVYAASFVDAFIRRADPDYPLDDGAPDAGAPGDDDGATTTRVAPDATAPASTTGCDVGRGRVPASAWIGAGLLAALAPLRRRRAKGARR